MSTPLEKYQSIIDSLVEQRECSYSNRISINNPWPETSSNFKFNKFIETLSSDQKEKIAELLQLSRDSGIHDTLVILSEKMNLEGLRFTHNGEELPHELFGTEIYFDWVARAEGVILGCTEIPLLLGPEDISIPSFATTDIHCIAAIECSLEPSP